MMLDRRAHGAIDRTELTHVVCSLSGLPLLLVCVCSRRAQQCDGTKRGVATQPEPPVYATEATTTWATYYSCPAHQGAAGAWGWTFLVLLSVSGVLYVGAGYGYNYKLKEGEVSHPHQHHWQQAKHQGPQLVMDGVFFTRCQLSDKVGFLSFLAPTEEARRQWEADAEKGQLLASGDGETSTAGRTKKDKRRSKSEHKEKRSKSDKKESKSSKKDRRESKSKVSKQVPNPASDSPPKREIKDVAAVDERILDIEMAEGNIKE
jgi:hypothetical protein